jgi:hypothetical protein
VVYFYDYCTVCTLTVPCVHWLYCVYIDCTVCILTVLCVHWLYFVYIDCRYFIVFFILQNHKNKPHKFTLNIFIWFYCIININKRQRMKLFQKKFLVQCTHDTVNVHTIESMYTVQSMYTQYSLCTHSTVNVHTV